MKSVSRFFSKTFHAIGILIVISILTPAFLIASVPISVSSREFDFMCLLINDTDQLMRFCSFCSSTLLVRRSSVSLTPPASLSASTLSLVHRSTRSSLKLSSKFSLRFYINARLMLRYIYSGVSTIRAYGQERRFELLNQVKVDTNHKAFFYLWTANRWLCFRTDFISALIVLCAGAGIISSQLSAGWAGLSLAYALDFTDALLWVVRCHADMEVSASWIQIVMRYQLIAPTWC